MSVVGPRVTFLFDVDNTLLDNDRVKSDLAVRIRDVLGDGQADRFWELYEMVRADLGVIDLYATLGLLGREYPALQRSYLRGMLDRIPFERYLFPGALDTVRAIGTVGPTVVVSDGDERFQPRKIARSGIAAQVGGRVLIYKHKEQQLEDVARRYPAESYVLVDDKARVLSAAKQRLGGRVTTVHVRQGHYGRLSAPGARPDLVVDRIGDVADIFVTAGLRWVS